MPRPQPIFKTFLLCCNLASGGRLIGIFGLIYGVIGIVLSTTFVHHLSDFGNEIDQIRHAIRDAIGNDHGDEAGPNDVFIWLCVFIMLLLIKSCKFYKEQIIKF